MRPGDAEYKNIVSEFSGNERPPIGRFAPSPTGKLHFGSLVSAVGSYLQVRRAGGLWLIRIEDLDPPRERAGAAAAQLTTLARFGLLSDRPVQRQSRLRPRHDAAMRQLLRRQLAFHCACSRRDLPASGVYPGTCRRKPADGRPARSVRFRVEPGQVRFVDLLRGPQNQVPAEQCGDFIILRADGLIAYQLAVVVDDGASGVTEVVRGSDLLDSTGRQILLQEALGLPRPAYLHLPLIVDDQGRKLSKSRADDPVERYCLREALRLALRALGHEPPAGVQSLESQWRWALKEWSIERIPTGPIAIDVQGCRHDDYTPSDDAPISL